MLFAKAAAFLHKFAYPFSRIINSVGVGILAVMMLLTASDVILRYGFHRPITGADEATALMMAVLVSFGLAYSALHKAHIRIDFLTSRFNFKTQAFLSTIDSILGIGIFSLIAWQSILYAGKVHTGMDMTASLHVPLWPFVWVTVIGSASLAIAFIVDLLNDLAQLLDDTRWWTRTRLLVSICIVVILFLIPILGRDILPQISPIISGFLGIFILIVLLFFGIKIGITLAIVGLFGMVYLTGLAPSLGMMSTTMFNTISSYNLSIIPLFILMGIFCVTSGMSRELYFAAYRWFGRLPGGLAMATVAACAGFACVSGSALATVATIGSVALPEMKRHKYAQTLATGCIAAGGSIGVLIPPSILLVIYGILTEQSIGALFLAGFIPGILEAIFYMLTIYVLCRRNPMMGPIGESASFKQKLTSLKGVWGILLLFLIVIGGIYFGICTVIEAAGIGAFGAFLFALGRRELTWKRFTSALVETGNITAMAFLILIGAIIFGYFLAVSRLPFDLADILMNLSSNNSRATRN